MGITKNEYTDTTCLRTWTDKQLTALCAELRWTIINYCAAKGGHLAANLGAVELTVAMHAAGLLDNVELCFDGAHAVYAHKCLMGKWALFDNPARRHELHVGINLPDGDQVNAGFIGSCGALQGRSAVSGKRPVIVVGDGALGNGVLLQALNVMATSTHPPIVVLNDNAHALMDNVGGLYDKLRTSAGNIVDAIGYHRILVTDGHNVGLLRTKFAEAMAYNGPVCVHVYTVKGKGFPPAEADPTHWHCVPPFNMLTARQAPVNDAHEVMDAVADEVSRAVAAGVDVRAINTGLVDTGLPELAEELGDRFVDVGIAEEQAAYTAVGMATLGAHVVIGTHALYAQRMGSVLMNLGILNHFPDKPVNVCILACDAAVRADNYLQMGLGDTQVLGNFPGGWVCQPTTLNELHAAMRYTLTHDMGPVLMRLQVEMPVGSAVEVTSPGFKVVRRGNDGTCIVACGPLLDAVGREAAEMLDATLVNPLFAGVVDETTMTELIVDHDVFVLLENGFTRGGVCQPIAAWLAAHGRKATVLGVDKIDFRTFTPTDNAGVYADNGLTADNVEATVHQLRTVQ
jgi:1-deoxy-D-xylulose-5-phosphate synthase